MATKVRISEQNTKRNYIFFYETAPVIQTRAIQFMATSL